MYYLLLLFSFMAYVMHASEGDAFISAVEAGESRSKGPSVALECFDSMESILAPDTFATREVLIGSALRRLKRKRNAPYENFVVKIDACHRVHVQGAQQKLNNLEGLDFFIQTLVHRSVFQIDLSQNFLRSSFPAGCLASLKGLNKLNVSHNQLDELPTNFTYLEQLEYFNGSHNKISSINLQEALPTNRLKYIDLGHNQIKIVENVGQWRMAKDGLLANKRGHYVCTVVLLDDNEITSFPEALCGIGTPNKFCLSLCGNPINKDSLPQRLKGAFLNGGCIDLRRTPIECSLGRHLQKSWKARQADNAKITILYGENGSASMNEVRSKWPTYFHDEQPELLANKKHVNQEKMEQIVHRS